MKTQLIILSLGLLLTACSDIASTVKDTAKNATSSDSITIDGMTLEYANMPDEPLEKPLDIVREPKVLAMTNTMTAAVKADGTLWTWGKNKSASLLRETRSKVDGYTPAKVPDVNDAVAVAAGNHHFVVLKKNGTVYGWGFNEHRQIQPGIKSSKFEPINELRKIEGIDNVVDIAAGINRSFFLTKTGEVFMLGESTSFFDDVDGAVLKPTKIEGFKNIVSIKTGLGFTLGGLDKQGDLHIITTYARNTGRENPKGIKTITG